MVDDNNQISSRPNDGSGALMASPRGMDIAPAGVLPDDLGYLASPPVDAAAAQFQFNIGMLIQRKWTIILTFLLIVATSIPLIWLTIVPQYNATAVVRVKPVLSRYIYKLEENGMLPLFKSFLNTQVSEIRSSRVLRRVLDLPAVQATSWYQEESRSMFGFGNPVPNIQRLLKAVSVRTRRESELIDVSVQAKNPRDAKVIADAVVHEYFGYAQSREEESSLVRKETLDRSLSDLEHSIKSKQRSLDNASKMMGTNEPEEFRSQLRTYIEEKKGALSDLRLDMQINEWRLADLESRAASRSDNPEGDEASDSPDSVRFASDVEWRNLKRSLDRAKHDLENALEQYGSSHPVMRQLEREVTYSEQLLEERETQLAEMGPVTIQLAVAGDAEGAIVLDPETLAHQLDEQRVRAGALEQLVAEKIAEMDSVSDRAVMMKKLARDISNGIVRQEQLQERVYALEIEGKSPGRIEVAAEAMMPSEPSRDRRIMLSLMAIVGAFAGGVGLAFLRAVLDPSMRRGGDVTRVVQMPFLGTLPKVRFESEILDDECVGLHERMRMIRTAFLDRVEKGVGCSVLITSPSEGAGKTSVSILLAKSLAGLGKKVLLVDADFRRSGLTRRLDIDTSTGLMDVLTGKSSDAEVKVCNRLPRVDVIPSGATHEEEDMELLATGCFSDRMKAWKEEYDYVVLDGPPILPVADARIMAAQVDGSILTLRAAHCRRGDAIEAANLLYLCGGVSYGSILVGTDGGREGDHFNYGYGGYAATAIVSTTK